MKPTFKFYFADEPQFCTDMSRADLANRLRAYRRQPGKFRVYMTASRYGNGYRIEAPLRAAVAIIERAL